jgi:phosphotransferase system enzyme I (PtsP)
MGVTVVADVPLDHTENPPAETRPKYTLQDLQQAIGKTQTQLLEFQKNIKKRITESVSQIFAAHLMILEDVVFIGQIKKCIQDGTEVPAAISRIIDKYIGLFVQSSDPRTREKVDDLEDLKQRLLDNLTLRPDEGANRDYHGQILITPKLFPSTLLRFVAQNGEGIILTSGGVTAHISVLARSLAVPMILADAEHLTGITPGTPLLMDAHAGLIYVHPDAAVIASYESLLETKGQAVTDAESIKPQTYTRDGRRIRLLAAVGLVSEAKLAHELRAEGIGLYRSEMSFLIRSDLPTESEQVAVYRQITNEKKDGEIVFRTLDIGGDKLLHYFPNEDSSASFLGLRGIRFTFQHRDIFSAQIRALLRASHDRPLKIMFPVVSSVDSFIHARDIVKDIIRDLTAENIPHQANPDIGAMIELPCAIGIADELAAIADFLSIGSNDLVQYMLAVDRTNNQVANWHVPWHPSVLRAINTVVEAAYRHNKPISICGNMASDPKLIPVLIGMGITTLTLPPRQIPQVQQLIQSIDSVEAKKLSQEVLALSTVAGIAQRLGINWVFPSC